MPGSGFAPCKENGKAGQEGMCPPFPLRPRHIFRDCPWAVIPTEGSNAQIALKNGDRFSGEQKILPSKTLILTIPPLSEAW